MYDNGNEYRDSYRFIGMTVLDINIVLYIGLDMIYDDDLIWLRARDGVSYVICIISVISYVSRTVSGFKVDQRQRLDLSTTIMYSYNGL